MTARRTERVVLGAAAALAIAVPAALHGFLSHRIDDRLEPAMADALGTGVQVGSVEAGLDGSLRVEELRVGRIFEADALEASVGLSSLLSGDIRADELRLESPVLRIHVDDSGQSNLERLARRVAARRASRRRGGRDHRPARHRLRRIIVTGGDMVVQLGSRGTVTLHDVEARPQTAGLRLLVGSSELDLHHGRARMVGGFRRAAGDLALPAARIRRGLAVGGALELSFGGDPAELTEVAVGHRIDDEAVIRVGARVSRSGSAGQLSVTVPSRAPGAAVAELRGVPLRALEPLLPAAFDLEHATATGRVAMRRAADRTVELGVAADLVGAAIDDRRFADRRAEMDWQLTGRVAARTTELGRELVISGGRARSGAIALSVGGRLSFAPGDRLPATGTVRAELARAGCGALLASLPEPMRDRLVGMRARGTARAAVSLDFTRADESATQLDVDVDVGDCRILAEAPAADPARISSPFEHTFPDGSRRPVGYGAGPYATLRSLPRYVPAAWVAAEDGRFFRHGGFDLRQIERSLAVDLRAGAFVRGGSTISQQLVKNVFLSHERTVARKLQEAVLTWRLESHLGKRLILERYLNVIELGPGIYGLPAAASYWFDKDPAKLSVAETAFLVALTPAPSTISRRVRERGAVDPDTERRVRMVLRHMWKNGAISERQYERARRAEIAIAGGALARR